MTLVLHLPFREKPGSSSARDVSGNSNHGTVYGQLSGTIYGTLSGTASGTTWVDGISGKALSFNGSSSYVDVAHDESLNLERTDKMTFAFWINISDTSPASDKDIICKVDLLGANAQRGYRVCQRTGTTEIFFQLAYDRANNNYLNVRTSTGIGTGWHHIVITYAGDSLASSVKIYVDGTQVSTTTSFDGLTDTIQNTQPLHIGMFEGGSNYFNGVLDEVRIYKQELSASEVLDLYHGVDIGGGRVLCLRFDEGYGTSVTSDNWCNGNVKKALSFDGQSDYVDLGNAITLENNFTIAAWIKAETPDDQAGGVIKWGEEDVGKRRSLLVWHGGSGTDYYIWFSGFGADANLNSGVVVNDGKWYHVVATVDSSNYGKIYVNGQLKAEKALALLAFTSTGTKVGKTDYSGTTTEYYKGIIDEVSVYNRVLTASEIQDLYNGKDLGGGRPLCLRLDEGSGTTVYSDNKCEGKYGSALSFDKSDDYVSVTESSSLTIKDAITVTAWVKMSETHDSTTYIVVKAGCFGLQIRSTFDGFDWFVDTTDGGGTLKSVSAILGSLSLNTWYHVVGTYDGSAMKIYVNGELKNSLDQSQQIDSGNNVLIGGGADTYYLKGVIDDVRIYNEALSADEIKNLYRYGQRKSWEVNY